MNASGHSTVRITEDAPWTSLELHDDAAAWVDNPGAPRGVFNLYLHDRANATLSSLQGGSYRHLGSGVLTIKDTVVPMEFGSQREVRIWLPSPESRTIFENVETLPGGAWFPGCWAVCPPLYGILATDAGYLRAVNSSLHLELLDEGATVGGVAEPRVHWLELEDSVAYNVNGPVSYQDGFTQNSGECAVLRGTSATNHRYDDQCVGLDVRVEDEEGQAIADASLRMVSTTGEPIDSYDFQANEASPDRTTDEDGHASFAFAPRGEPFTLEVTSSQGTAEEQMVLVDDEQATIIVG